MYENINFKTTLETSEQVDLSELDLAAFQYEIPKLVCSKCTYFGVFNVF